MFRSTVLILFTFFHVLAEDIVADFRKDFEFGLATAPAHVEDQLYDSWIDFAHNGGVAAFHNHFFPEDRLRFWTNPLIEIDLAASTGAKIFRMGIAWDRLVPKKPIISGIQNKKALKRYRDIMMIVRSRGMKVMLSLFHHSLPMWAVEMGGFTNPEVSKYFSDFSIYVMKDLKDIVDSWIIYNEPSVFALLTYSAGIWPPGKPDKKGFFMPNGSFSRAIRNMSSSHIEIYKAGKKLGIKKIGIANNVTCHVGNGILNKISAIIAKKSLNYEFVDRVAPYLDFHGINYYGEEHIDGLGVKIAKNREYSDSGRAINPNSFYELIMDLHTRYNVNSFGRKKDSPFIPFIITENGISDSSDVFRPSYIIEHLMAVRKAMSDGVPITGYIFWTISDNFEWADGYCPKFGLVEVDRRNNLIRIPRYSYNLFSEIVQKKYITSTQRKSSWAIFRKNIGTPRDFCRSDDGQTSFDIPIIKNIKNIDWRFSL